MKSILTAVAAAVLGVTSALAADLPPRPYTKAPPAMSPAYNWTGFYIGANAGYAWTRTRGTINTPNPGDFRMDGGFAGAQVGANYQFNSFVIGAEADFQWSDVEGIALFGALTNTAKMKHFGTVRGRLGWAWDRVLVYGTGGWAFGARTEFTQAIGGFSITDQQTLSGWTAGGGVEYAMGPSWSAKVEYLHVALDQKQFYPALCPPGACMLGANVDLVRAGLNFRGFWQ